MVQRPESEFTLDTAAELARIEPEAIRGRSPWYLAWRRLRRNYFAFFSLAIFILVVAVCAAAPLYAHHVAHTGPNDQHVLDKVKVNGHVTDVVSVGGVIKGKLVASIPIGPTWFSAGGMHFGADTLGRDVAVRPWVRRSQLAPGRYRFAAICVFAVAAGQLALLAGYFLAAGSTS